jgi:hypothetical protein
MPNHLPLHELLDEDIYQFMRLGYDYEQGVSMLTQPTEVQDELFPEE